MELVIKCLALSVVMSFSCKLFFETLIPLRKWEHRWIEKTIIPAFVSAFMIISFSEVPPYIFQALRLILAISIITQIYYKIRVMQNVILSVLFCALFWITNTLVLACVYALSLERMLIFDFQEDIADILFLCLIVLFHHQYKGRMDSLADTKWVRFGYFPIFSLIVIMSITIMLWGDVNINRNAIVVAVVSFGIINILAIYFIGNLLEKEAEMQKMRLSQERNLSQMNLYRSMQTSFDQQRKYLHDYKNQLLCIQGRLEEGQTEETLCYVKKLTGGLQQHTNTINTNHNVVNVVLNQKYQYAQKKGIALVMKIGDLSSLNLEEEDIVTLLVNLLDNAIEACDRLKDNKIIQFKIILEEGQLILSVRNPVEEAVEIKDKTVLTTKKNRERHGVGLHNINSVIEKYNGTSTLQCRNGWFTFSAMLPSVFAI